MSIFSSVPINKTSRSTFNMDHEVKLSFDFGGLYPLMCQTMLPGDKASLGVQTMLRTMPLISPVMHRNDIKLEAFFVPMRLIWPSYEKWLQCVDTTIKMPQIKIADNYDIPVKTYESLFGVGSLADYLGFASVPSTSFQTSNNNIVDSKVHERTFCALPFRSYQLIYDYYYRNKTLESSVLEDPYYVLYSDQDTSISQSTLAFVQQAVVLKMRSWRRDLFTSSLPNPQKGNPILFPESDLEIVSDGNLKLVDQSDVTTTLERATSSTPTNVSATSGGTQYSKFSYHSGIDVVKSNSPTMEDIRYAEVLEEYDEALARAGAGQKGAFKEWLLAIWRTLSPDARLDRPEFLGGYRGPIQISEVPQTSSTDATSPQGTLAGKGLSVGGNVLFRNHVFKEPGYLMLIMSVVPKSAYFQGDPRQFLYESPFDFPNPYFANLGEQEVYSREVCASQALCNSQQQQTFGYQVRNYEMKQIPDSCHGQLRSSLLYWHESRVFPEYKYSDQIHPAVNLNYGFVKMEPSEVNRIFPVVNGDKLIGEFWMNFRVKRSLPYYGVPRIGHTK